MSPTERTEGPTPAGGAYSIAYFCDEDGLPSDKENAVMIEIHEYDSTGQIIARTYQRLRATPAA